MRALWESRLLPCSVCPHKSGLGAGKESAWEHILLPSPGAPRMADSGAQDPNTKFRPDGSTVGVGWGPRKRLCWEGWATRECLRCLFTPLRHQSLHGHSTHCMAGSPREAGASGPHVRQRSLGPGAWRWAMAQERPQCPRPGVSFPIWPLLT